MIHKLKQVFSLIEMLVIASITLILFSLLLPSLSRAIENGKTIACANQLRQFGTCLDQYYDAFGGRLPYGTGLPIHNFTSKWLWLMIPYISEETPAQGHASLFQFSKGHPLIHCPSDTYPRHPAVNSPLTYTQASYGFNIFKNFSKDTGLPYGHWGKVDLTKLNQVESPSTLFMVGDSYPRRVGNNTYGSSDKVYSHKVASNNYTYGPLRHMDEEGGNVLYFDNHVEYFPMTAIYGNTELFGPDYLDKL